VTAASAGKAGQQLSRTVHLPGGDTGRVTYKAGTAWTPDLGKRITNPLAWVDGPEGEPAPAERKRRARSTSPSTADTAAAAPAEPTETPDPATSERGQASTTEQQQGSGQTAQIGDPPPRSGAGSGRDVWAAYAEQLGQQPSSDDSRDDIIAALETAGLLPPS
jgi:hypothetical protein